jgi:hypothetical protein
MWKLESNINAVRGTGAVAVPFQGKNAFAELTHNFLPHHGLIT